MRFRLEWDSENEQWQVTVTDEAGCDDILLLTKLQGDSIAEAITKKLDVEIVERICIPCQVVAETGDVYCRNCGNIIANESDRKQDEIKE